MRQVEALVIMAEHADRSGPIRLKLDKGFEPCPAGPGDEYFANGIFEFNITRLLAFVGANADRFPVEQVEVCALADFGSSHLEEAAVGAADLSRPILLAEIAPGQYGVIDGHHRVAKARRQEVAMIPAYRIRCPVHVAFLTSTFAYEKYVAYWNDKVEDSRETDGSRRIRRRRA
jgi:hypothetical protein